MEFKQYLKFITKDSVKISIEEFLFLWLVKTQNDGSYQEKSEIIPYADLYFAQNVFYGRDEFPKEDKKVVSWNLMIDKLEKQEYLIDTRSNKKLITLKEMLVTDLFKDKIWFADKDETCERLKKFITDKCGLEFRIGDSNKISYFMFNQRDTIIYSLVSLNDYFWKNICKEGDGHCIEKFFALLSYYLEKNTLAMKVSNLLINYYEGTMADEIQSMMDNQDDTSNSKYRLL